MAAGEALAVAAALAVPRDLLGGAEAVGGSGEGVAEAVPLAPAPTAVLLGKAGEAVGCREREGLPVTAAVAVGLALLPAVRAGL